MPPNPKLVLSSKMGNQVYESYHAGAASRSGKWEGTSPLVFFTDTQKESGVEVHLAAGLP